MTPRARLALALIALLVLVAVVYRPVTRGVFIWDDHALVETNPVVQRASFTEIFRQPYWADDPLVDVRPPYYRPLTILSFRGDFAMAGELPSSARAFHFTNLLLHLLATIALVLAARRLGASTPASIVAAAVWALHPRATEAVAWISGRTDVLATALSLIGIALWPWFGETSTDAAGASTPRSTWVRAAFASAFVVLGLFAKEVAIAVAIAIVVGTVLGARGPKSMLMRSIVRRLAVLVIPLIGYAVLRYSATRGVESEIAPLGPAARTATFFEGVGRYVEMTLDPWHSSTSIGLVGEVDYARAAVGATTVLTGVVLVVRAFLRRRAPSSSGTSIAVGVAIALTSLGVVVHIVPIVLAAGVVADRLLYLPLAGVALALAVAVERLSPRRRQIAGACAVTLAATFLPVTHARASDYTNELRFRLVAAEQAHPHNTSMTSGLANLLRTAGEVDLACRLHASSRRQLERIGRTGTLRHVRALENLGSCYELLGEYDRAADVYRALLVLRPEGPRVHMELGYLHLHQFELDEAEASFRRAVALDPKLSPARIALADLPGIRASLAQLATEEARRKDRNAWAQLLARLGRVPDATRVWLEVVLDPETVDGSAMIGALFVLTYGTLPDARRAVAAYKKYDPADHLFTERLAWREARQAKLDAVRPRLEALAAR